MSSFARRALLWLGSAAVKAQDELAALGLDGRRTQPKITRYPGKGKYHMNLLNHRIS